MKKRQRSVVLAAIAILALVLLVQSVSAQEPGGRRRGRRGPDDPEKMLERMDKDGDKKISSDEFRGPDDRFKEMDSNSDGFLSSEELSNAFKTEGDKNKEKQEKTSDEPRPDRPRRFDRSRMHERMMDHIKENIGSTDEEWNAIKPLVEKVLDARMATRMVGFWGGRRGPESDIVAEAEALKDALDSDKTTPEEIKQKLTAFRDKQKQKEQELAKARDGLRKVLTVKQEAQLVLMGILD